MKINNDDNEDETPEDPDWLNNLFDRHGWAPIVGQPGLFKSKETGEIGNIRDHCPNHFVFNCKVAGCPFSRTLR